LRRLPKALLTLSTAFYLSSAPARADMSALLPTECTADDACTCFSRPAVEKIAKELTYAGVCRYEVEKLRAFAEGDAVPAQSLSWYQEPEMIIGGVVVSVSLGLMLGFALGK